MSPRIFVFGFFILFFVNASSASVFGDIFSFDLEGLFNEEDSSETRDDDDTETSASNCQCDGPVCNCCLDFNITSYMYLDLGGPGCVKIKYLSQTEGMSLNISYGESVLHSVKVKSVKPKPTCMDLLSDLAQICTKFSRLSKTEDGLKGCLSFEPTVLGEITSTYHIGCFSMGPKGMSLDNTQKQSGQVDQPGEGAEETGNEEGDEEEEEGADEEQEEQTTSAAQSILEAVNKSAEEGIAFFTDLLGLKKKNTTEAVVTEDPSAAGNGTQEKKTVKGKLASFFGSFFY